MKNEFSVKSYRSTYKVNFIQRLDALINLVAVEDNWFIIDRNVATIYKDYLKEILSSERCILVSPEESNKSYEGLIPVIQQLIEYGFKRNNKLVAIGGGITQDITAFISSVLYRGVQWIFLPTNLLSQCDSCIGSKTSINFKAYKNQIGGFYPPSQIYICLEFLKTLDTNEIYSGIGEMAHYYLIDGRESFEMLRDNIKNVLSRKKKVDSFLRRSLDIKRRMIEKDEFDEGPRNIFNYGHSFGHAIEGYTNYSIPHGIAVSYGMDIANAVSVEYGYLSEEERMEIREVLKCIWTQTDFPKIEIEQFISILSKDKKNVSTDLRLILTKGLGTMFIKRIPKEEKLITVVNKCLEDFHQNV